MRFNDLKNEFDSLSFDLSQSAADAERSRGVYQEDNTRPNHTAYIEAQNTHDANVHKLRDFSQRYSSFMHDCRDHLGDALPQAEQIQRQIGRLLSEAAGELDANGHRHINLPSFEEALKTTGDLMKGLAAFLVLLFWGPEVIPSWL